MKSKKEDEDWNKFYKKTIIEDLPWFTKKLDYDLENEIKERNLKRGRFLDLGTGDGTQAREIAKYGFDVTGSDISEIAIENAKKLSKEINFLTDDILNSKLPANAFDYVFDRGIFHLFNNFQRPKFVKQIKRILDKDGIYFLKCMSIEQEEFPDGNGPNRLSKQEIIDIFRNEFEIEKIKPTVFEAINFDSNPKAWFVVLKKKSLPN
ncbi:MAG: class I SAM-dependent methyltransferase [Nitrosopumilaceae archaeon]